MCAMCGVCSVCGVRNTGGVLFVDVLVGAVPEERRGHDAQPQAGSKLDPLVLVVSQVLNRMIGVNKIRVRACAPRHVVESGAHLSE
jgi:hypothetical protein